MHWKQNHELTRKVHGSPRRVHAQVDGLEAQDARILQRPPPKSANQGRSENGAGNGFETWLTQIETDRKSIHGPANGHQSRGDAALTSRKQQKMVTKQRERSSDNQCETKLAQSETDL